MPVCVCVKGAFLICMLAAFVCVLCRSVKLQCVSCCAVVGMFVCRLASLSECVHSGLWLCWVSAGRLFSSSPSVCLRCRVTLIPLISAKAQQGRGVDAGLGGGRETSLLQSVHPLIWYTHLCLFVILLSVLNLLVYALFFNSNFYTESQTKPFYY